ncbi:hypothetical protein PsYK624_014080 [Phanerochaete sordida]|uniref:DUF6533 domain-containing protein n=1 Tax=Phanerochaete sordida TaxID=48140 RepID=A0A9P3L8B1_9APHY|nr:hypothetical protein PsYK624_014080 [Phanerochaete sordida]
MSAIGPVGYKLLRQTNYYYFSSSAVLLYEYMVTLPDEITCVWMKKWTLTAFLVLAIRYFMIMTAVSNIFQMMGILCLSTTWMVSILQIMDYLPSTAFAALRIYALCPSKRRLVGLVLVLGLAPMVCNGISTGTTEFIAEAGIAGKSDRYCYMPVKPSAFTSRFFTDYSICKSQFSSTPDQDQTKSTRLNMLAGDYTSQGAILIQDIVVLVITWSSTYRQWKNGQAVGIAMSLTTCLLRDGTAYFLVMLSLNVAQIAIFDPYDGQVLGPFVNAVPLMLASRFILNLRQANEPIEREAPSQPWSSAVFKRSAVPIGNISEPLDIGNDDVHTDDEGEYEAEGSETAHVSMDSEPSEPQNV